MGNNQQALRSRMKSENEILSQISEAISSSTLVSSMDGITKEICDQIAIYTKDWWSWNPNRSEPSLDASYVTIDLDEDTQDLYHSIINGSQFTLTASLTTPKSSWNWTTFIGGTSDHNQYLMTDTLRMSI